MSELISDSEDVTAARLAEHMTLVACRLQARAEMLPERERGDALNAMLGRFGIAFLLRALLAVEDPDADDVARRLWEAMCDGATVNELLADWSAEGGEALSDGP